MDDVHGVFVDGERVMPASEVAHELGISVQEVERHGADWSFPSVRVAGTFYGCRRDHLEVWRAMLEQPKPEARAELRPARTLAVDRFVDVAGDG